MSQLTRRAQFQGSGFTEVYLDRYTLNGQLSLRGTMRLLTLGMTPVIDGSDALGDVDTTLSRSDFGIGAPMTPQEVSDVVTIRAHGAASLNDP